MNVALYIAKRYLFTKSSNNAINIMTSIAASGVVIASAALFIVLSGFAGLKDFSLEFSSFVDPDLKVLPSEGKSFLLSNDDLKALKSIQGVSSLTKIVEERVVIEFDGKKKLATIKGVDENYVKVTAIDSMIIQGNWFEPGTNQVVSGGGIAYSLSFGVLDYAKNLMIYVPKPGKGQINSIKSIFNSVEAYNVGVFDINEELNNEYIYADIETARSLLNYSPDQISAIELKLSKTSDEALVRSSIIGVLGNQVEIKNRTQLNDTLYKMLNTENVAVYLIFTLVIIIALFNVIGALIMMILDKKESLHTLFNLGTSTKEIKRIFFLQGSLMTSIGGLIGLFIGFIIVFLQQQFALVMITPSLPYPVTIKAINFIIVLLTIGVLGVFASKIASSRITKTLVKP
ncbi:lipoprotein-releasing system permease protein [Flavobacteriaceae bacterium MAR_2010_105]|nr:lipoprotein-releasing system permease protein [Flavobacteriaceae bacterium MAR_2010_105]